jgi:hypothetical protein
MIFRDADFFSDFLDRLHFASTRDLDVAFDGRRHVYNPYNSQVQL